MLEDNLLVYRCLNGDKDAFGTLVDKYKDAVYGLAYSKVRNFHDAQDIAQEAFIDAYKNLRSLRYPHRFSSWIYTIVANRCRMWMRKRPRESLAFAPMEESRTELSDQAVRESRKARFLDRVLDAINELPESSRLVMTLYYIDGLTCREIGEFTGTSVNTVKSKLRRARAKLREEFEEMPAQTMTQRRVHSGFITGVLRAIEHFTSVPRTPPNPISRVIHIPLAVGLVVGLMVIGIMNSSPPGGSHTMNGKDGFAAVYPVLIEGLTLYQTEESSPESRSWRARKWPGRVVRGAAGGSDTKANDEQGAALQCKLLTGELLTYKVNMEGEVQSPRGERISTVDGTHILLVTEVSEDGLMRVVNVIKEEESITTRRRRQVSSGEAVVPEQEKKWRATIGLMYVGRDGRRESHKERNEIVDSSLRLNTGISTAGFPEDPYFVPFPSGLPRQGDNWKTTRIIGGQLPLVESRYIVAGFQRIKSYDCLILERKQVFSRVLWETASDDGPPEQRRVKAVKARIACDVQSGIVVEFHSETIARYDPESGDELPLDSIEHVTAGLVQRERLDQEGLAAERQVLEQIESTLAKHHGADEMKGLRQGLEEIKEQYPTSLLTPGLVGLIADVDRMIDNAQFCSPNPFRPGSSNEVAFGTVGRITIHDHKGQIVRTLWGSKWDGTDEEGQIVPPGVYFYRAEVDEGSRIGKLTVIY